MAQDARTLAIVLGASNFPHSPVLGGGEAFENSAQDFRAYLYHPKGLNLPVGDVLDLFDDDRSAIEMLERIQGFLSQRQMRKTSTDIARLLVYYVGHGGFTPGAQEYFLTIRATKNGSEGFTSLRISDLGHIIKNEARVLCQYLILDCCFSAQAYLTFQAGPADAAITKTLDRLPTRGTALLCSSGPREISLAPQGCGHTMFSDALLTVLRTGDPNRSEFLSLFEVRDLIDWQLKDKYQDERVRPQVQCPNQPEGDLSHLPLFPNPAYKSSTELRRVIVPEDSPSQLPNEVSALLRNSLPSVRLVAVSELLKLFKCTSSRTLAGLARAEIQECSEKDDSTQVRTSAKDALLECDAFERTSIRSEHVVATERYPTKPLQVETASEKPALAGTTDLESLNLFLEAAHKLNQPIVLEDVFQTLLEASLRLTKAERGFVFLRDASSNELRMVAGRNENGEVIPDDSTTSRSVLRDVATSAEEFVVTDTTTSEMILGRESVVAENLKVVICIPLRRTSIQGDDEVQANGSELQGVLYLDSHFLSGKLSEVSQDILRILANGAATLVENASLQEAGQAAKLYRSEMSFAREIQQRLMTVPVPDVPYAKVKAVSYACKDIGGDFFDLVYTEHSLSLVVADVSGKGVSAAVVASTLQGMLYSQLALDSSLPDMLQAVNKYVCERIGGQKYSTLIVARLHSNGELELINCGGVPPLLISGDSVQSIDEGGSLPIGLIPGVEFHPWRVRLNHGDRILFATDGVTEAEDSKGEFFGLDRLKSSCRKGFDALDAAVTQFRGNTPLTDDCTLTELIYCGGQ